MPQLDDEFLETEATNLKIARKLLVLALIFFLVSIASTIARRIISLPQETEIITGILMLAMMIVAPIGLVYSIRSLLRKEPGKKKRLTFAGLVVFNVFVVFVWIAIIIDIMKLL